MNFRIPYQIGTAHGETGYLYIDTHTNGIGHSLITSTLGVPEVERRLREAIRPALEGIAREVKQAVVEGARIG